MAVQDGRITLPGGVHYPVLVLAPGQSMTPELLRKIKELVAAGATVVGAPPTHSPSLGGYPECDSQIKALAGELWGPCDGKRVTRNKFRNGLVICGEALDRVFATNDLKPDFAPANFISGWPL